MPRPTILILGPTAGGKTQLSIALAQTLNGECICCDSMQVYRGMDIGTAKPTSVERAAVPHHLLDVVDPDDETFSVERWLELAQQAIADIRQRDRWPIIVGGTNLYVQAFLYGIAEMPAPDPALRQRLNDRSSAELRELLVRVDPQAAERIHRNDRKRMIRAIEVFERAGVQLSQMQTQWARSGEASLHAADVFIIGLDYPVQAINRRINARVKSMIEHGLVDEVRGLLHSGKLGRNAREALGYKQIIEFLEGKTSLEDAVEQIKIRTRRFAKQQRTWLRRFRTGGNSAWINVESMELHHIVDKAVTAVRQFAPPAPQHAPT